MSQDYKNQIEALLFASGRFMDADTLLQLTGVSNKLVLVNNVKKLKEEYEKRSSPLMVVEEKDGWKLTVREAYLPLVRKIVSETELPKTMLETLAVIAWKAPVLQSEVVDIRHNKAYDHIAELLELGFIKKEHEGRSYRIGLTEKFYEYFDVEGSKDIREVFKKISEPDQRKVDDFEGEPDWYKQGAAFLEEALAKKNSMPEANEKKAHEKPRAEEKKEDPEEFSEL
ncbi:TPA: SMC-Scp complex subunit ScpB [Candidatus Woesearchaeota archaeon]|nr:Segregation and condensation protein B [archaeon GW2011_AR15]MBS3103555.1 SMC-Scp complex subunit ScpB [Candidatus Woesearchaeota archaeon]HIH41341.1 SMC-Scp complex subunit ScpB [Candidatus Woesearchaeota archaeon]